MKDDVLETPVEDPQDDGTDTDTCERGGCWHARASHDPECAISGCGCTKFVE